MLAHTFKSAKELRISQAKYDALVKVYWMFADEKIPEHLFNMETIGAPMLKGDIPCGTPGCILGWCQAVDKVAYEAVDYSGALHWLFYSQCACDSAPSLAQAAQAIHNFLITGSAKWRGVLQG